MTPKELRVIDGVLKDYQFDRSGDCFEDGELDKVEDSEFQSLRKEYIYKRNALLDYLDLE